MQDRLSVERWINEGGHVATEAVIQHEIAAEDATHVRPQDAIPIEATLDHFAQPGSATWASRLTHRPHEAIMPAR